MSFYESDIAVVLFLLFGINSIIKGKIEFQLESGKQGINTIVEKKTTFKKGLVFHGMKARAMGATSICLGLVIHVYCKTGSVIFAM